MCTWSLRYTQICFFLVVFIRLYQRRSLNGREKRSERTVCKQRRKCSAKSSKEEYIYMHLWKRLLHWFGQSLFRLFPLPSSCAHVISFLLHSYFRATVFATCSFLCPLPAHLYIVCTYLRAHGQALHSAPSATLSPPAPTKLGLLH
jgi:hypothetical protein